MRTLELQNGFYEFLLTYITIPIFSVSNIHVLTENMSSGNRKVKDASSSRHVKKLSTKPSLQ